MMIRRLVFLTAQSFLLDTRSRVELLSCRSSRSVGGSVNVVKYGARSRPSVEGKDEEL